MALSPLDIKNKTFPIKMRGYNSEEVDDFIDQVITDYEDVLTQRRELEKALKHADEKLTYFNELKDALNQSIIVAQDTADKVKESAIRESDLLLSTANAEAKDIVAKANITSEQIIKEANRQARDTMTASTENASRISTKSDELKKHTREYHRSLTLLLESQLEIVKSKDWKDLLSTKYIADDEVNSVEEVSDIELPKSEELAALIGKVYEPEITEVEAEEDYYDDYYEYYEDDEEEVVVEEVAVVEPVVEAVVMPTPEVEEEAIADLATDTEQPATERKRRKRN